MFFVTWLCGNSRSSLHQVVLDIFRYLTVSFNEFKALSYYINSRGWGSELQCLGLKCAYEVLRNLQLQGKYWNLFNLYFRRYFTWPSAARCNATTLDHLARYWLFVPFLRAPKWLTRFCPLAIFDVACGDEGVQSGSALTLLRTALLFFFSLRLVTVKWHFCTSMVGNFVDFTYDLREHVGSGVSSLAALWCILVARERIFFSAHSMHTLVKYEWSYLMLKKVSF